MTDIHTIIFDLGGVLIDWNPRYVFDDHYFDTKDNLDYFFEHICTSEWNENQDAGYPIVKATEERVALFPQWEKAIRDYYGRWTEMLRGPIAETVDLFSKLRKVPGLKLYALTNWSAETFPIALERFEFLHWFDGRVVSGEEKMRKPFPEFYRLLLNRYQVNPARALLIDDNFRNIKAAETIGIKGIHFINPVQLENELARYSIPFK